jgi:F0F1-type ATP synthase membrane subunit b/b'
VKAAVAERETLERLQGDEADLERVVATAREEATAMLEAARREAEAIVSETRREAEREVERLRAAAADEIDRALANAHAGTASDAAVLRRRAEANWERAAARAIAAAVGSKR